MATIRDVAKLAGVSVSTVSIVLNNNGVKTNISPETTQRVRDAIDALRYHPNMVARRLHNTEQNKPIVVLYWPSDRRGYSLGWVLSCIQQELKALYFDSDLQVCIYENDRLCDSLSLIGTTSFSAAIIGATSQADMEYLEQIEPEIPVVLLNCYLEKYHTVCGKRGQTGKMAAQIFAAHGHKRVGLMLPQNGYLVMGKTLKGFHDACHDLGVKITDEVATISNTLEGGAFGAERIASMKTCPKALFCASDQIALGAAYTFNRAGISIPGDMEIIAVGLMAPEFTAYSTPSITTIATPLGSLAEGCAQVMAGVLRHDITGIVHRECDDEILYRESCKP